jgi:hypothetical protein
MVWVAQARQMLQGWKRKVAKRIMCDAVDGERLKGIVPSSPLWIGG